MNTKIVYVSLALLSLCGGHADARGVTINDSGVASTTVSYGDLDLSGRAGGQAMLVRITHAAKAVCGGEPYDPLWSRYEYKPCVSHAIERAVARLNNPVVTALNGGVSKAPVALASR